MSQSDIYRCALLAVSEGNARLLKAEPCDCAHTLQASEMMQGVTKPTMLYRLDANLWSTSPKPDNSNRHTATSTPGDVAVTVDASVSVDANSNRSDDATVPEQATSGESAEVEATHAGMHMTS